MDSQVQARMNALRGPTGVAIVVAALALAACGGGGGDPGTCRGSPQVCFGTGDGTSAPAGPAGGVVGLFSASGTGDTSFQLPATVTQVQIQASFTGTSQNFVVRIGGAPVVNTVVGTSQNPPGFSGTFQVSGGSLVEISGSAGVSWQVTEVRG